MKPMKSWQSILINGCITVVAVFVAIGIFVPDAPPGPAEEIWQSLDVQVKGIQLKLAAIENAVLKLKELKPLTPPPGEPATNLGTLNKLDQKLDMVLGRLSVIENMSTQPQAPPSFGGSQGPPVIPRQLPPAFSEKGQGPVSWIDSLPDDKKLEVEIIFEEHLQRMRNNLPPPDPDGNLPDRETISNVMKEGELLLKQNLKTILSEEEFQQFLDSHPEHKIEFPNLPAAQGDR